MQSFLCPQSNLLFVRALNSSPSVPFFQLVPQRNVYNTKVLSKPTHFLLEKTPIFAYSTDENGDLGPKILINLNFDEFKDKKFVDNASVYLMRPGFREFAEIWKFRKKFKSTVVYGLTRVTCGNFAVVRVFLTWMDVIPCTMRRDLYQ